MAFPSAVPVPGRDLDAEGGCGETAPVPKFRWGVLVPAVLGTLIVLALIRDVWTTYSSRRSIEKRVDAVARDAAQDLPYKINEAMTAALEGLRAAGIEPRADAVEIAPDGTSITVRGYDESTAWFAWLFGVPRLHFAATSTVRIEIEGGGPVGAIPRADVLLALGPSEGLRAGDFLAVRPGGAAPPIAGYVYAYRIEADGDPIAVGDVVRLAPHDAAALAREAGWRLEAEPRVNPASISPASPRLPRVAVVDPDASGETGTVVGFAAFLIADEQVDDGKVRGSLLRILLPEDPQAPGARPGANPRDFGLRRAGKVRVL